MLVFLLKFVLIWYVLFMKEIDKSVRYWKSVVVKATQGSFLRMKDFKMCMVSILVILYYRLLDREKFINLWREWLSDSKIWACQVIILISFNLYAFRVWLTMVDMTSKYSWIVCLVCALVDLLFLLLSSIINSKIYTRMRS